MVKQGRNKGGIVDISSMTIVINDRIADGVLSGEEFIFVICNITEPTSDLDISDFKLPDGLSATQVRYSFANWSDGSRYLQSIDFKLLVEDDFISKNNSITLVGADYAFKSGSPSYDVSSQVFDIKSTHPTVTIDMGIDVSEPISSTEGIKLTFLFSEPVYGFTQSDIVAPSGAGSISTFQMESDLKYTAIFTPNENTHLVDCAIEVQYFSYSDPFGNSGLYGESVAFSINTSDLTPPMPALLLSSDLSSTAGINITVSFDEMVAGFDKSDIHLIASDGYLSQISPPGDGKSFTFHYTPQAYWPAGGGSVQIEVAAGGYTDLAGNAGLASEIYTFNVDVKPPSFDVVVSGSELASNESRRVDFIFSEAVKDFDLDDLTLSADVGSLDHFQSEDSAGLRYSVIFTPTSGIEQSGVKIVVGDGYTDIAGNSARLSESAVFNVDTLKPGVTITLADAADNQLIQGESLKLLLTFTEAVKDFSLDDLTLSQASGVLGNFQQEDAEGKVYSVIFTPPSGMEQSGIAMLLSGDYTDLAGNPGVVAASTAFSIDTLAPAVSIVVGDSHLTRGESTLLTFTFTEAVSDFSADDVCLDDASVGLTEFTVVEAGKKFTALYTPPVETIDANNIFSVAAGSYTDLAGNLGDAAQSDNVSIDTVGKILFGTAGSEAMVGTAGADRISGLPQSGSGSGKDSSDLLIGLGGADVFVLGNQSTAFYNDGNNSTAGAKDYAAIADFSVAEGDKIEARAGTYFFSSLSIGKLSGAGLYLDTNNSGVWDAKDELIGFLVGVNPGSVSAAHDLVLV